MLRSLMLSAVAMLYALTLAAQTPRYVYSGYTGTPPIASVLFHSTQSTKWQCTYYPGNFAGMPNGSVSAIYFCSAGTIAGRKTGVYAGFRLRIGYTTDSFFKTSNQWDTFRTGLTTILDIPSYTMPSGIDTPRKWIKIPVGEGIFNYDSARMFIVELAHGTLPQDTGCDLFANNFSPTLKPRSLRGPKDSARVFNGSAGPAFDLGFDLRTGAGVFGPAALSNLEISPSPAKEALELGLTAARPVDRVEVILFDAAGRRALTRNYSSVNGKLRTRLDVGNLPRGHYYLRLSAGHEVMVRPVVLE